MRLYISILAVGAMSISACGKKAVEPKPEPAKTEEVKKEEPKPEEAKKEEPKPEEAKPEEAKKEEPAPAPAADRTEGVQKALEAWAAGKTDEAFANFTDDAVQYNVGSPAGAELTGKTAILEREKAMASSLNDVKLKASRIIEAGDTQIIQAVMTANIKTKGADGAEVVKAVATPMAMVLKYNADGKVVAQWNFMDEASIMQQIGAIPGLPEGFVAATLPEATEVIKGEANLAHAELHNAFMAKMGAATVEAAVAEHFADDFAMVDAHTGKTLNKAEVGPYLKAMASMFADETATTDMQFSVGEYYVNIATMTSTYKEGIPGATPDAKIKSHMLSVSRIVDGKFKSWAGYSNGLEMYSQLGLMGGAAEKPAAEVVAAPAGNVGVAECDLYIAKMTECLGALPDAAKSAIEQGMKTNVEAWKKSIADGGDAVKGAMATGCKSVLDAAKSATGSLCPNVKWE